MALLKTNIAAFVLSVLVHLVIILPNWVSSDKSAKLETKYQNIKVSIVVKDPRVIKETPSKSKKKLKTKKIESSKKELTSIVKQAGLKTSKPPTYPLMARKKGWEGSVEIAIKVSEKGKVVQQKVTKSSGHKILDEEAIKTVLNWSFEPAVKNGSPISSTVLKVIEFKLLD
ncbi:MAG: energy transducer TonB [Bacteriovoracaceae bacterium]|nr:energy transducer TonB [Bacteriovoracaceae bacterium]